MSHPPHHPALIGHNSGAAVAPGHAMRVMAWRQARAGLKKPSAQVTRMMLARAAELGLSYADYANLTRAAGRDIGAFLFTPAGLRLRLGRRLWMPPEVQARLAQLSTCRLLALAPEAEPADAFLDELRQISGVPFAGAADMPQGDGWTAIRTALAPALSRAGVPSEGVALVSPDVQDVRLVAAARLAGVLPPAACFG